MKVGDFVRVKRIWVMQPPTFVEGLIIDIKSTRWSDSYRILTLLTKDNKLVEEPLDLERDAKHIEYIAC